MLTEAMNDADSFGGIRWCKFGMVESHLFLLSVKVSFKDRIMLILGLSNKFLMHRFYYYDMM